jgi:hypothetical protein
MYDWQSIEDAILLAARRGEHLRRAMHNRLELATLAENSGETYDP